MGISLLEDVAIGSSGSHAGSMFQELARLADADVDHGLFVCVGSDDNHAAVPTSAAEVLTCLGLVRNNVALADQGAGGEKYAAEDSLPIVYEGLMFVTSEDAVVQGEQVFVRFATGTGTVLGSVRSDDDTATAAALPGARFATSGTGLVKVRINLPS